MLGKCTGQLLPTVGTHEASIAQAGLPLGKFRLSYAKWIMLYKRSHPVRTQKSHLLAYETCSHNETWSVPGERKMYHAGYSTTLQKLGSDAIY